MKLNIRWRLLKDAVIKWLEDEPFQLAAALSYYTLFSLAPLLIIVISIAGFAFGRDAAQDRIVETIQGLVGRESAQAIQTIIQNASSESRSGVISTVFGFLILLIGAGGVVGQLQTSLNTIWGVTPKAGQGSFRNWFSSFDFSGRERLADGSQPIHRRFVRHHRIRCTRLRLSHFHCFYNRPFCDDL